MTLSSESIVSSIRAFYDRTAASYAERTFDLDMTASRLLLSQHLAPGARVLDAGCGSGRDALAFAQAGYKVDAFDASSELVAQARKRTRLPVQCHTFDELDAQEHYEGIWACASLVHLDDVGLVRALDRLLRALKPSGVVFMSLKKGDSLRLAEDGRVFNDFTLERLSQLQPLRPLSLLSSSENVSALNSSDIWLNAVFRKPA